jgi:hypothetical protein
MAGQADGNLLINQFKEVLKNMTSADGLLKTIQEVEEAAYGMAQQFGLGAQNIDLMRAGLADAASDVKRLGGTFQDVVKMQESAYSNLGRSITLSSEGIEQLFATTKATGQSADTLISKFKDIGTGVYDIGKNMETVVDAARSIGVNAKAVSDQALSNMDMMNKYNFEGGVQGLAKMAAQAVNLRVNVSDMKGMMDKAFEPEGAIELAATMQRLGATQSDLLDPLRLMDLAQNDPAELMNQVAELGKQFTQFNEETGKFEIAPGGKRQLMELAKAMNIPYEQMTKMALAGSELDDKLSKISFPSGDKFADEDTQKMIANMAEMKDGQYIIKFKDEQGVTQEKNVTELKDSDIEAIAKAQSEAPKTMEEIAESQLSTLDSIKAELESMNRAGYALAGSKAVGDAAKALRTGAGVVAGGIRDMQGETGDIRKGVDKTLINNLDAVNKALNGEGSLNDVIKTATGSLGDMTTALKDNFKVALENATTELDKFSKSGNMFGSLIETTVRESLKKVQEHEQLNKIGVNIVPEEPKKSVNETIKVGDFTIQTHPEDTFKHIMGGIMGGTGLDSGNMGSSQNQGPVQVEFTVNVKSDKPINEDHISQIKSAIKDTGLQKELHAAVQNAVTEGGMTGSNNTYSRQLNTINKSLETFA